MEKYFVVRYEGPFGFIKPWTAVRDSETYSQQFLTPSIIEGMEKKLFPELLIDETTYGRVSKIKRYRLNYQGLDMQQERTWSKGGIDIYKDKGIYKTNLGIILRGVMLNPHLYLAFENELDANLAMTQTLCLCRNEDLIFPMEKMEVPINDFDTIDGFELVFTDAQNGFKVGHNRFDDASEMYGKLKVFGNPIRS
ncbi:MAG: hypothetical protein U0T36_08920 [Saprospiraceae bacterium]|jgi:hypothetical protein